MKQLKTLIESVENARQAFIAEASDLTYAQIHFKPTPDTWSIIQNVEHIVRAEQSGVFGLFKAIDGYKRNDLVWSGNPIHRGLSIEEVVDKTWQPKEKVPEIAAPIWGGSLNYWLTLLNAQTALLKGLGNALEGLDLEEIIFPHPISGPLDAGQRLDFLRFHLARHQQQVQNVKAHLDFPK